MAYLSVDAASALLLNALINHKGMQAIVELSSGLLSNPIAVGDIRLTVLYTSSNMPPDVPMSKPGMIPPVYSTDKSFIKANEQAYYSEAPILTEEQFGGYKTLLSRLCVRGEIVGYMSVLFYYKAYSPEIDGLVEIIRQAIEAELTKNTSLLTKSETVQEAMLSDMLSGKKEPLYYSADTAIRLGIQQTSPYTIAVFRLIGYSMANSPNIILKEILHSVTGAQVSVIIGSCIVILKPGDMTALLNHPRDLKQLKKCMKEYGLYCGASYPACGIEHVYQSYRQALSALRACEPPKPAQIMTYEAAVIPDFIKKLKVRHKFPVMMPELTRLIEYDAQNHTRYCQILKHYIESGKNTIKTAQTADLSRSSVYRILDRISAVADIDFSDNEQLFGIYFGMKIMDIS